MTEVRQDTLAAERIEFLCDCGESLGKCSTHDLAVTAIKHDLVASLACSRCGAEFEIRKVRDTRGGFQLKHERKAKAS